MKESITKYTTILNLVTSSLLVVLLSGKLDGSCKFGVGGLDNPGNLGWHGLDGSRDLCVKFILTRKLTNGSDTLGIVSSSLNNST